MLTPTEPSSINFTETLSDLERAVVRGRGTGGCKSAPLNFMIKIAIRLQKRGVVDESFPLTVCL